MDPDPARLERAASRSACGQDPGVGDSDQGGAVIPATAQTVDRVRDTPGAVWSGRASAHTSFGATNQAETGVSPWGERPL